jgi:hypothetical protein
MGFIFFQKKKRGKTKTGSHGEFALGGRGDDSESIYIIYV